MHDSETRFRQLADAMPHIAWITGPDGSVDFYNRPWYDYSGLTFEETRDWGWSRVIHPDDVAHATEVWRAAIAAGTLSEVEYRLRRADGEYRWHLGRSVPVQEDGAIVRWVGTATDIEDRRRAEEALRQNEQRLRLALDGGGMGTWHWDLTTGAVEWPPRTKALFGLPPDVPISRERLVEMLHPDDRDRVDAALRSAIAGGPDYNVEYRVIWPDGSEHWVASRGRVYRDGGGVAVSIEGVIEDISARQALAEREHRIAQQLQSALQPGLPDAVPGLALAHYYRPALEDQGVGGDFSDVFSTEAGVTFLVVGDLSGKGLAAASQVAMVRHMLRFALYNGRTVAGPVARLNDTLEGKALLSGFSTLFVGRYDAHTRSLTYVNCGQDAGLIRRAATGRVEPLPPTGPILGAVGGAVYSEETVVLEAGDVLALYTDGLTEAGPTRSALLMGDGVASLLEQIPLPQSAAAIVTQLMVGVDAHTGSGIRDDQCLLVGVVAAD